MAKVKTALILLCEYSTNSQIELSEKEKHTFIDLGWINEDGSTTKIGKEIVKTYGSEESLWD